MRTAYLLLTAATVAGLVYGCGIATAPVSLPAAVAENANFSFKGKVVTAEGQPLEGVLMSQRLQHYFWTPVEGGTETDEPKLRRVDREFKVEERGRRLEVSFSRDGYYDASYYFTAGESNRVQSPMGDWPTAKDFPVVMLLRNTGDTSLSSWAGNIDYSDYPDARVINLNNLEGATMTLRRANVDEVNTLPPGTMYLTLTKETPAALNSKGDIDPADVNLPGRITLHISGAEGGLVRIEPRIGFGPMQVSDMAPESGYKPELTIERKRLKEMRASESSAIIEGHEYFFIRATGRYGKGMIRWSQSLSKDDKRVLPVSFHYRIWMQRSSHDRNLITRTATLR